jgi:hypothetical protein
VARGDKFDMAGETNASCNTKGIAVAANWLVVVMLVSLIFCISSIIYGFRNFSRMLTALRVDHPESWDSLNRPRAFSIGPNQVHSQNLLRRYLEQRSYLQSKDQTFISLCDKSRRALYFQATAFMSLLLSGLAFSLMK